LLLGPPGVGKTYFSQSLAKLLGVSFHERDLSVMTEAFTLTGMDSGWKNSKPGLVFDALANGPHLNPLILLNEVDKAHASGTHNSPLSALYGLLEPESAGSFIDEFVQVPVDARHILWFLTANEGYIPEPVLSRLEVFRIGMPSPEQREKVAQSVWTNICASLMPADHPFNVTLPPLARQELSRLETPRDMKKTLIRSASRCAEGGVFDEESLLESIQEELCSAVPPRRSAGFL
jgi:ATP-dependent Lon protease